MNNWQRDPRWGKKTLGNSLTLIEDFGCTISAIGNIIGVTPDVVNERLKSVDGFLVNLVIWAKIEEAFPGIKIRRVWTYNNDDVKTNVPNVIVEVPALPIGGHGSHWVQYKGNQKLNDPWTGKERPTSDFPNPTGYCVITGKWTQSGLPANYAEIIGKATNWDEVNKLGYHSIAALKLDIDKWKNHTCPSVNPKYKDLVEEFVAKAAKL